MRISSRFYLLVVGLALTVPACWDDVAGAGTDSGTDSDSATDGGGTDTAGPGTDSTGTGTATGGDTGGTSGDVNMGHTAVSFVNAGGVSRSASYHLVWSFGQESQNQNTMDSGSYTLHGGLIGAAE